MVRFLIGRLLSAIPTLFVVTLGTFLILWLVPGDISAEIGGIDATAEDLAAIRERLGLDRPLWERALLWYGNLFRGDLGYSYRNCPACLAALVAEFNIQPRRISAIN